MLKGQIAQLVEQRTENPRVGGSIPSLTTDVRRVQTSARLNNFNAALNLLP